MIGIFKAFFLAGEPGSGKTFVTKKITGGLGLKNVNSDTAFEVALKKAGLSLDMMCKSRKRKRRDKSKIKTINSKKIRLIHHG